MKRMTGALAFLACALAAPAQDGLIESGDQCVYSKDGLFLKVALVDDPKEFLSEWAKPLRSYPPALKTRTSFHRGDTVFPAVMYSTNSLSPEGKADIVCTLLYRRPDGSIYENPKDMTVADGPPPKGVALGKTKSALKIEDMDPFGDYTLKVTITDRIKDVTVEMLFTFSVVDPAAKPALPPPAEGEEPEAPAVASPTPMPTTRMRSFSDDRR